MREEKLLAPAFISLSLFALLMVAFGDTAPPTASSTVEIPFQGSVRDNAGATWSLSGTARVEKVEPITPVPIPPNPEPPIPLPPAGITFSHVEDYHGNVLTRGTAGIALLLKGTGFPTATNTYKRMNLAGKAMGVHAWTATSLDWGIPNTLTDSLTAPITGPFEIYEQVNGTWVLRGKGGAFTIMPSGPAPGARAKRKK